MKKLLRSAIITAVFGLFVTGIANARIYDSPSISTANNSGTMGLSGSFHFGTSTAPIGTRTTYLVVSGTGGIVGDFGITMGTGTFNTVRVGSMTSYGTVTSSTGFIGGGSTFTSIVMNGDNLLWRIPRIVVDTATLKTRIDNLDTSTASLTTRLDGHDLFRSSASVKIEGWELFKTTGTQKIESWVLSQSTISSRLTNIETNISTGFNSGGSTFTTVNANYFIGNGSKLTNLPSSGGSGGGDSYEYYSYVIGDYAQTNASSATVNCSSNTKYCFDLAKTVIGTTDKGMVKVRKGTYTFLSEQGTFEQPNNITFDFEDGAVIEQSGNFNVYSCSGTLINPTFKSKSSWVGDYFFQADSSANVSGCKFIDCSIGDLNLQYPKKALSRVTGYNTNYKDAHYLNTTFTGGTDQEDTFLAVNDCDRCSVHGIKSINGSQYNNMIVLNTSWNVITNIYIKQNIANVVLNVTPNSYATKLSYNLMMDNVYMSFNSGASAFMIYGSSNCSFSNIYITSLAKLSGGWVTILAQSSNAKLTNWYLNNMNVAFKMEGAVINTFIDSFYFDTVTTGISDAGSTNTLYGTYVVNGVKTSD